MKDKVFNISTGISKFALFGLLFFIPISNAALESFSGFALLGFLGRKFSRPDFESLRFRPNIYLLLFFAFNALSLINSQEYLRMSLVALFGKWFQYIGLCILVQDILFGKKLIKKAAGVFLFSASLVVLSGLTQKFLGFEFLRGRAIQDVGEGVLPIRGSFVHYNNLGAYLVVVIPVIIALSIRKSGIRKWRSFYFFIFATLSLLVLIFTTSRGSWLSVMLALGLMLFLSGKYRLLLYFLITIFILIGFPVYLDRLTSILTPQADADRFKYWTAAFRMIKENPFLGKGLGTFMVYFSKYIPNLFPAYAHNCYLQIWAETGIFSLVTFFTYVIMVFRRGIRCFFKSQDFLLLGLLCGLFGFLVHSFFDTNLYSLQLAVLFWILLGLISASIREKEETDV